MKNFIISALILLIPSLVGAAEISCKGTVSLIMADHTSCRDDNGKKQLAFKVTGDNYWLCSGSDSASSLVLSVKMSEKNLVVYFDDNGGSLTCQSHRHYLKPKYIINK
ncbi:hypothetical protein L1D31_09890 [Vibrio sp. Isolate23]|uniref:hypothetical protein n=1 Tax=Vibrio sp. Isolate23 TaxID=2908533 RepID=UPI001EFE6CC9|nr:hypothetical protein [Vibrio sp. Isolate23]MCG9682883.1 hypothetical protein [Vibrio sp. Isolate23]